MSSNNRPLSSQEEHNLEMETEFLTSETEEMGMQAEALRRYKVRQPSMEQPAQTSNSPGV